MPSLRFIGKSFKTANKSMSFLLLRSRKQLFIRAINHETDLDFISDNFASQFKTNTYKIMQSQWRLRTSRALLSGVTLKDNFWLNSFVSFKFHSECIDSLVAVGTDPELRPDPKQNKLKRCLNSSHCQKSEECVEKWWWCVGLDCPRYYIIWKNIKN